MNTYEEKYKALSKEFIDLIDSIDPLNAMMWFEWSNDKLTHLQAVTEKLKSELDE